MPSPTEITPSQLSKLIGTPNAPMIVDVRTKEDFSLDPFLIPGAVRHSFEDAYSLELLPDMDRAVVYCQKGLKISQGFAALLRLRGIEAETLMGGQFAWRDASLPMVMAERLPAQVESCGTRWVTRQRPKVDRIACSWLIKRFVDPKAEILFVAAGQVMNVAERFSAVPFDVEGAFWAHRGELCTFDVIIEELGIATPALLRLATIVRGADTARLDLAPQCAGLLAASLGFSRMFKDDLQQLNAAMALYDSFYRWARDAVDEEHHSSEASSEGA